MRHTVTLNNPALSDFRANETSSAENVKRPTGSGVYGGNINVEAGGSEALKLQTQIYLEAPKPITNPQLTEAEILKELASLEGLLRASSEVRGGSRASAQFQIELTAALDKFSRTQNANQREKFETARETHKQEHKENLEKLEEAQQAKKEAEKAGLATKIFGWITSALAIIAGVILTAAAVVNGASAVAGVALIVGGVVGLAASIPAGSDINEAPSLLAVAFVEIARASQSIGARRTAFLWSCTCIGYS